MSWTIIVAAGQLGPVERATPRAVAVARMATLMERAKASGAGSHCFPRAGAYDLFPALGPTLGARPRRFL